MEINDIRNMNSFKGGSFSKYKMSEVKTACISELERANIINSFYWFMELLCSGHVSDIWEIIIQFYGNKINVENPKMAIYLEMMYNNYKNILTNGYVITN